MIKIKNAKMINCETGIKIEGFRDNVYIENVNFKKCNKAIDISSSEIETFFCKLKEQGIN